MEKPMAHWQKALVSTLLLIIMLAFAFQQTLAPDANTNSELDYEALAGHVAEIAHKPHPMGSAANRSVRDYIVSHFESLGLDTEVQKTTVVYRHPSRPARATIIGNVENIIARLPGRQGNKTEGPNDLVLMGHYDSRPLTPGAGDDASGTASIMETARIMAAGPPPVHDVVFLITDGEEMGLLGAQGFFRQHPAAKQVGLVLNFEARGSYGASLMFETSKNNAWLVDRLIE
jgi:acetylornithine deacetylase/succinyl-diaminopimelate desuccinylase-like protein